MESNIECRIAAFRQQNPDFGYCVLRSDRAVLLKVYLHGRCVESQVLAAHELAAGATSYPPHAARLRSS